MMARFHGYIDKVASDFAVLLPRTKKIVDFRGCTE
jgi:hypothetical protein